MSWKVDYAHTSIQFAVKHMMISTVRGQFEKFNIDVHLDDAELNKIHDSNFLTEDDILNSHLVVKIEAASLNTQVADRDKHLRSADFLDAEKYPYIVFTAKRGEKIDDTHGKLIGDLTIQNVTHEVTLDTEFLGEAKTPWAHNMGFSAHTKLSRKNWGLTYNMALETGGWLVGDEVKVDIEIEFSKVAETAATTVAAEVGSDKVTA